MESKPLLEVEDLKAYYGKALVIQGVSLSLGRGEILAILGRNGVGKTTLLKALMGIEVMREGRIFFESEDISRLSTYELARRGIFYMPDDTGLFPGMSTLENLRLVVGKRDIDLKSLVDVYPEIRNLLIRKVDLLSGGERKIVSILRALLTRSKLLLLDEPSEGVMPIMVKKIYSLLAQLRERGLSIIVVEPGTKLKTIMSIATMIGIMNNGRLIYVSSREEAEKNLDKINKYLFV